MSSQGITPEHVDVETAFGQVRVTTVLSREIVEIAGHKTLVETFFRARGRSGVHMSMRVTERLHLGRDDATYTVDAWTANGWQNALSNVDSTIAGDVTSAAAYAYNALAA